MGILLNVDTTTVPSIENIKLVVCLMSFVTIVQSCLVQQKFVKQWIFMVRLFFLLWVRVVAQW